MEAILGAITLSLWLGILTSISPCPLASNIAAVTYITKNIDGRKSKAALNAGLLYVLGRVFTYVILAVILIRSVQSVPELSFFLQNYMNILLGPLLILVGMFLLEMIKFDGFSGFLSQNTRERLAAKKYYGAFLLGALFALSFCPVSAALYFGSFLPLAIKHESAVILPSVYGIGTGLPVFAFALVIVFSVNSLGRVFEKITHFEKWARTLTGIVFIGVGIYYALSYIFKV